MDMDLVSTNTFLQRQDIIEYEPRLKKALKSFLDFSSSSLIFPTTTPTDLAPTTDHPYGQAVLEDDRLMLPLVQGQKLLAIFSARGIDPKIITPAIPYLPTMAALCLEHILLYKQGITDPLTGLYNVHCLQQGVTKEISDIMSSIMPGPSTVADESLHSHSACFGLIIIDLDRFKHINDTYGHLFGDNVLTQTAEHLREICPRQTLLCRLGGDSFAIFWPQALRSRVKELAHNISQELGQISCKFTPLREDVHISASIGFVNYPQDFQGALFGKAPAEQYRLILEKAGKAVHTAQAAGRGQVYSFRQILSQGGVVLEIMPMNRLVINLGRNVDAHEGQRFLIWSRKFNGREMVVNDQDDTILGHYPPMCKGEISLVEVQDDLAIAEVLFQTDPDWIIEKGDKLTLLDERSGLAEQASPRPEDRSPQKDALTGLYPYRDFLQKWQSVRGQCKEFCMVLMRLENNRSERSPVDQMKEEQFFQALTHNAETLFGPDALGGRYSMNCIIYHVPDVGQEECARLVHELFEDEQFDAVDTIVGLAGFPFLDSTRSEILDNVRKALDHATLLQGDKIACFDSISLNISADRLFAREEIYDAITEYKRSLTADEHNFLARNSLGICYARLNKYSTARTIFQDLVERHPGHIMLWYNYGCASLKDGDTAAAQQAFERILDIAPDHIYALARLGLMAEEAGHLDQAWTLYQQVKTLPEGERLACRYLARLAFRRNDGDTAREFLHQAITTNPQDAYSFHLLARIYLEQGDDPEIAESLARQSVHLKPDTPAFWDVLITALDQQGKTEEVAQTKIRAAAQKS